MFASSCASAALYCTALQCLINEPPDGQGSWTEAVKHSKIELQGVPRERSIPDPFATKGRCSDADRPILRAAGGRACRLCACARWTLCPLRISRPRGPSLRQRRRYPRRLSGTRGGRCMGLRGDRLSTPRAQGRPALVAYFEPPIPSAHRARHEGHFMSDDRWIEVRNDFQSAQKHFETAQKLYLRGSGTDDEDQEQVFALAFMHAMQAGYTSLESGMVRIMTMVHEDVPQGEQSHADVVRRMSLAIDGKRPALLGSALL